MNAKKEEATPVASHPLDRDAFKARWTVIPIASLGGTVAVRKISAANHRKAWDGVKFPKPVGRGKNKRFRDEDVKKSLDAVTCNFILYCVCHSDTHEPLFECVEEVRDLDAPVFVELQLAVYNANGMFDSVRLRDELKKNTSASLT